MKSYDNARSYQMTRIQELTIMRNEAILERWLAQRHLELLTELGPIPSEGEMLEVRIKALAERERKRDSIIREWEINRAAEGAE